MRSCRRKRNTLLALATSVLACTCFVVRADAQVYRGRDIRDWTESLDSDDVRPRWYATLALARMGPEASEAVGPLMELLAERSQYEYVRAGAAFALGGIQAEAERVVPLLAEALDSELASVRRHSARALGRFGKEAESAVPTMLSELRRDDPIFRIDLAEALWHVARHEQAIPYLIRQVRVSENPGGFEAAEALGRLAAENAEGAVPGLVESLGSDNADVARSAARSLGRAGIRVIPQLAKAAETNREPVRRRVVESYAWMGPAGASGMIAALSDTAPEVRRAAARGLGRLGAEVAAVEPALLRAVNDPDLQVRATAAAALKQMAGGPQ